jgi:N-acyl-D-amino-acid deacylase
LPPRVADISIGGDIITSVGAAGHVDAETVIDVGGLAVTPGFIDAHSHSEFTILREPPEARTFSGVTTEINGNCGLSAAPLFGDALTQRQKDLAGIAERWSTFDEYFEILEKRGLLVNYATLTGHGNIRASAMGYENRRPTAREMEEMKRLTGESLRAGSIGLSTGLIYPPGVYSDIGELIELVRFGKEIYDGFIYTSHMRSEGEMLIEALEEVVRIGREADVSVSVSHIKTAGRRNWHKIDEAVSLLERARSGGIRVTCDRYPYTAASTDLDAVLPVWLYEGGRLEELRRLRTPEVRERLRKEVNAGHPEAEYWASVAVATVTLGKNRWMEGKSIKEIASSTGKDPLDAVIDLLIEEDLKVDAIFHSMSEDNLRRFLSLPFVMVGSDSSARSMSGSGKPHPRGFGSFPRFLGRYTGPGEMAASIRKITALPAGTFGLKRRGELREGFFADIVVFDPSKIIDRATYENPYQRPEGIHHVVINGLPVLLNGQLTGLMSGRVLRHGV